MSHLRGTTLLAAQKRPLCPVYVTGERITVSLRLCLLSIPIQNGNCWAKLLTGGCPLCGSNTGLQQNTGSLGMLYHKGSALLQRIFSMLLSKIAPTTVFCQEFFLTFLFLVPLDRLCYNKTTPLFYFIYIHK